MRFAISAALLLTGSLAKGAAIQTDAHSDKDLTVKTTSGTYTGLVGPSVPDVAQWLGIQYGRPPIGALRFMPPQRAEDKGPGLSAQSYKPICMQDNGNKTGVFWEIVPEFQNQDEQSEDCLYLNIWGPRNAVTETAMAKKERLPVIVWVCGGSFKEGGGHAPYQVPDHWIQRTQTHLVVTFNYRLNIFGFPGTEAARTNAGLLDVRLVMEWLRDNIASFGGDPERMVLYGQSAGGGAVLSYLYANGADPIATGFIAASAGVSAINSNDPNPNFNKVAQLVGCANLTAVEELDCMRGVDAIKLRDAVVSSNNGFRPIVDGVTQFANLTERLEKGLVAKKPLIAGFTYNEAAAFMPIDGSGLPRGGSALPSALSCGSRREARTRDAYGLATYNYLYAGNFTNVTPLPQLGGMHSSDIPIVFGTHHLFRGNSTELEWQTSFAMETFWVNFATNSSAALVDHLGTVWPEYEEGNGKIIVFGDSEGPSASYISSVAAAEKFSGSC